MKYIIILISMIWPAISIAQLTDSTTRLVHMKGAVNFRDVGGYQTKQHKEVIRNRIFRSAEISKLTDEDLVIFSGKRIDQVIDFRGKREAAAAPDRLPAGTRYLLCSAGSDQLPDLQEMGKLLKTGGFLEKMYDSTSVGYYAERYKPMFQQLLNMPDTSAMLYHCTGGRDRTGMATALLLYALEVPMATIEADFVASNVYLQPKNSEMFASLAKFSGMTTAELTKSMELRPALLRDFFLTIQKKYGSMDKFYSDGLGINAEQMAVLRAKYTK